MSWIKNRVRSLGIIQGLKESQSVFLNPLNAELNPICHLLILLGDLTFMGPCIVSIFQHIPNKMQRYTVYSYLETALHVSDKNKFPDKNKLCNVASCWIYEYIGILLGAHSILHMSRIRVNTLRSTLLPLDYGCHFVLDTKW
jgi:hypothetical protein